MTAEIKPSYDTERKRLADVVPLQCPFSVFIEPTRHCNFKCFFCMHATRGEPDGAFAKYGHAIKHMDFALYERILKQLAEFPARPARIVLSGLGEPLVHPRLPDMIALAKSMELAKRLDILTNASLLTPELSDALIEAGTTRVQISLEGLDAKGYKDVTGANVDFDRLRDNIAYLNANKGSCSVFIKIIDSMLKEPGDRERFYELFGGICDQMYVEHLITLQHPMGDLGGKADNARNLNDEVVVPRDVCPVIFYLMQIDVDGSVFPCPVSGLPRSFALGSIHEESLIDVWNGPRRAGFIRSQLMRNRARLPVCGECHACSAVLDENENMDDDAERLLPLFAGKHKGS